MNLLEETIECLRCHDKSVEDVVWVGTDSQRISWEEFAEVANREYDNDFGIVYVNTELVVVGKFWWLTRGEYDGSEWWKYNEIPDLQRLAVTPPEKLVWEDYE